MADLALGQLRAIQQSIWALEQGKQPIVEVRDEAERDLIESWMAALGHGYQVAYLIVDRVEQRKKEGAGDGNDPGGATGESGA